MYKCLVEVLQFSPHFCLTKLETKLDTHANQFRYSTARRRHLTISCRHLVAPWRRLSCGANGCACSAQSSASAVRSPPPTRPAPASYVHASSSRARVCVKTAPIPLILTGGMLAHYAENASAQTGQDHTHIRRHAQVRSVLPCTQCCAWSVRTNMPKPLPWGWGAKGQTNNQNFPAATTYHQTMPASVSVRAHPCQQRRPFSSLRSVCPQPGRHCLLSRRQHPRPRHMQQHSRLNSPVLSLPARHL